MELFIALDEKFDPSTGITSSGSKLLSSFYVNKEFDLLSGIATTTSSMLGKAFPHLEAPYPEYIIDNIEKILRTDNFYLFKAHPSIEQIIRTRHTGMNLNGEKIVVCNPISLVYTDRDGNGWYITDAPVNDNRCSPMRITNAGNGYFEYFDNSCVMSSKYFVKEFENWMKK